MGTQVDIANKLIEKNADYILAVKGNQEQLLENIEDEFKFYDITYQALVLVQKIFKTKLGCIGL